MISPSGRRDLIERLQYTFITAEYEEIDTLIAALERKSNFASLCNEFFASSKADSRGYLVPGGFFHDQGGSASLVYAMYEILGRAPEPFPLRKQVTRIKLARKDMSGLFRIPRGVFRLPCLEVLAIRGIGISRFPSAVSAPASLRVLDLTGNRFSAFPESLLSFGNLSALNLSYNQISRIPDNLEKLKSLRILNMRGNRITQLPDFWYRFGNLKILDLTMNRISRLPGTMRLPDSLRDLRLSYNDLSASEEAMWEKRARNAR